MNCTYSIIFGRASERSRQVQGRQSGFLAATARIKPHAKHANLFSESPSGWWRNRWQTCRTAPARNPAECELFLCLRVTLQAVLPTRICSRATKLSRPLRGKRLECGTSNVAQSISIADRGGNNIITAFGVRLCVDGERWQQKANIDQLRYHKVVITTDADAEVVCASTLFIMTLFPPLYAGNYRKRPTYILSNPPSTNAAKVRSANIAILKKPARNLSENMGGDGQENGIHTQSDTKVWVKWNPEISFGETNDESRKLVSRNK